MAKSDFTLSLSLSLDSASILNRVKEGYLMWIDVLSHVAKGSRYTIGTRIENKFLDILELAYGAYFSEKEKKAEMVAQCVRELDTLKFLVSIAWEGKIMSHRQYEEIGQKLVEIGKMFGGWQKSLQNPEKKNRTL